MPASPASDSKNATSGSICNCFCKSSFPGTYVWVFFNLDRAPECKFTAGLFQTSAASPTPMQPSQRRVLQKATRKYHKVRTYEGTGRSIHIVVRFCSHFKYRQDFFVRYCCLPGYSASPRRRFRPIVADRLRPCSPSLIIFAGLSDFFTAVGQVVITPLVLIVLP